MERYTYPHTIENGAGERITFLRSVAGPTGDRLEVENVVTSGSGPPMHVHHHQDEALTVEQGKIGYQRAGESAQFAGPGETIAFKKGEAHKFWNAGQDDLRCTGYIEPADNVEYFLTELYASMKRSGGVQAGSVRSGVPDEALPERVRDDGDSCGSTAVRVPAAGGRRHAPGQVPGSSQTLQSLCTGERRYERYDQRRNLIKGV